MNSDVHDRRSKPGLFASSVIRARLSEIFDVVQSTRHLVIALVVGELLRFALTISRTAVDETMWGAFGEPIRATLSFLNVCLVVIIIGRCRNSGPLRIFVKGAASWLVIVSVAFWIHRTAESTPVDHGLNFLTMGLLPMGESVAGTSDGWMILLLLAWVLFRAIRAARSSRSISITDTSSVEAREISDGTRSGSVRQACSASFRSALMFALLGVFGFGSSVFDLFARQHVERSTVDPMTGQVTELLGPHLPIFMWSTIASALLGITLLWPMFAFVDSCSRSTSRSRSVVSPLGPNEPSPSVSFLTRLSVMSSAVWITALGFWVRVGTLLSVAPTRTDGGDPLFYHVTANLLARGRGFPEPLNFIAFERWIPSALHGPAYPVVLSISSRLGGSTYFDHKMVSILIGTSVVALSMALAHRISPSQIRTAATLITGLLAAAYPNLWLVDSVLFPEGLMALFTLGVVFVCYVWWENSKLWSAAAIGVLLGASALTRGEGLALSILLVVPLFLTARHLSLRKRLSHVVLAGLAALIVIAPWSMRNFRSFETFVPLSTNGNELFVYANCPPVYEGKFLGFWLFQCQEDLRATSGEPEGDEAEKALYWRERGFEFARSNLDELPRVVAARIGRQWDLFRPWQNTEFAPIEGRDKDSARLGLIMYYAMIPAGLAGLRRLRQQQTRLLPIGAVFAMVTLTAAYAYGTTRFRVPFEPLLCVIAAIGAASWLSRLASRWHSSVGHVRGSVLGSVLDEPLFVQGSEIDWRRAIRRSALPSWISYGTVAAAVAIALPALYRSVGSSMEEGFMLVFPELVMRGSIPNVDFLHLYGPGSLHMLSLWYSIFDVSLAAERTFGLIQHLVFVSGLMVLVRPWGRATSTAVGMASLLFVLTPVGLQALAWNGALGWAVWAVVFALRASATTGSVSWVISGLFSGVALSFRPDMALAIGMPLAAILWSRSRTKVTKWVLGLSVGLLPVVVHVVQAGIGPVIHGVFIDPVFRLRSGRELPRPPSFDRLDGALQVIAEKFAPWWGLPHLEAPKQLFVWFFLLPTLAIVNLLIARKLPHHRSERQVLMATSLFGIGLLPQAFQRPDSAHFLWVSAVALPLSIVSVSEWIRRRFPTTHPEFRLAAGSAFLALIIGLAIPFYTIRTYADLAVRSVTNQLDVREVRRNDRVFYLGDERPWLASLDVVADLDALSTPGERLFVGPVDLRQTAYSDVFFYHLFPDLEPATYYIEMDPGLANKDRRLAEDVASADWLILTRFWSGWIEPNTSIVFGSDTPNEVVENSFCLEKTYQNDLVRLFRRCAKGDGIGPYEGPYRPEFDYAVEVLVPVPPRPDGTCTPTCRGEPSETGIEIGIDTSVIE